jgi:hypothetical protein
VGRSPSFPLNRFLGDVRREFMQHLYVALHGSIGFYLRDVFHECGRTAVACLPAPRAYARVPLVFSLHFVGGFCFLCNKTLIFHHSYNDTV